MKEPFMNFLQTLKYNFQKQGVLTQIIIANVAVFLTVNLVGNLSHLDLLPYTALPIGGDSFLFKFWTIFTYMFTHASLGHIFWNMVLFYFMSQIFFTIMGQKKLLYLYVMSGLSGGALVLILGLVFLFFRLFIYQRIQFICNLSILQSGQFIFLFKFSLFFIRAYF